MAKKKQQAQKKAVLYSLGTGRVITEKTFQKTADVQGDLVDGFNYDDTRRANMTGWDDVYLQGLEVGWTEYLVDGKVAASVADVSYRRPESREEFVWSEYHAPGMPSVGMASTGDWPEHVVRFVRWLKNNGGLGPMPGPKSVIDALNHEDDRK